MTYFGDPAVWLPWSFAALMGLSILIYVVLDGFDLGVGLLMPLADEAQKDRLVASIGPFWDANETWLVLAVGLLLVAFPPAHGMILTALYLPVFVMLIGLILRGVSFEMRAKAPPAQKRLWNAAFFAGSLMAALSQGFMLGLYIMGLTWSWPHVAFATLTALCLTVGYGFIGAAWLIWKTEGALQSRAIGWAKTTLWGLAAGILAISAATPFVSARIFDKWFSLPAMAYLSVLPLLSVFLVGFVWWQLRRLPLPKDRAAWQPFAAAIALFTLAFGGMAYSFYPYVVPEKITLYDAAAAPESLFIILIGTVFVLPAILGYTFLSYYIFRGKATALKYD
ncbi:cytochrome d ubiquinol oxidase subunit II [uncultured Lentibacter sp.]|uniref:cytochrome d ubiquinol oxidase subunit II n=1 Tax=uncultured Lentibacter sp. TaxID=1659309 RepID=UPI0026383DCA|nr:cytochrome d ubiquinol oxidase subunit II [uncultured Lentibacter sp.]MCW1954932.1 cytochrome d ubiquinol oxidase subunit II [Roseobacter sp.]